MNCGYLRILEARLDKQNEINEMLNKKITRVEKSTRLVGLVLIGYTLYRSYANNKFNNFVDDRNDRWHEYLRSRLDELKGENSKGEN